VVLEVPSLRERREDIAVLAECFREQANLGYGLDIEGMSRDALAILEADDWPGNVRELEAVVKRAMIRRRRGRVTPEDVILSKLQRQRFQEAVLALEPSLTPAQRQALRLVSSRGEVRRGDLVARCGITREAARREQAGLVRVGAVRREASGRGGDTYRPRRAP
jgi:DNA-binding NtrC family response regulator